MKIRSSRAVTSATEFGFSMRGMIEQFFDRSGYSQYLVSVAAVSDLDMVQINLAIEGYSCWIAVYKKSASACEMKCSGPTFMPTTEVSKVMEWARIMNIFANIVDNIRRVIVPQMKMGVVESTIQASRDVNRMTIKGREIQNPEWAQFDRGTLVAFSPSIKELGVKLGVKVGVVVGKVVKTYVYPSDDDLAEKDNHAYNRHNQSHNFNEIDDDAPQSCVIRVHDDFKASQNGTKTSNLIIPTQFLKEIDQKTYVQHVNAIPRKGLDKAFNGKKNRMEYKPEDVDSSTAVFAGAGSSDVTVQDLADLMRAAWESANADWGNSAEDLLEWEDAFYVDEKYREGVARYVLANVPDLTQVMMNQVDIEADEDEDSSEVMFTILIDGQPVDKVRTWYVGGRWDAFMDEL